VQLFDRLGRRIVLTEAGAHLLKYAEKIVDLMDETRAGIAREEEPQGALTIRIPETFGVHRLPPILKRFHARFPKVRLRFTTCSHEGLEKDLRKGVTDLAFLLSESIQAADLAVEALGFESLVVVANPNHPLAARQVVRTRDLGKETISLTMVDCSYRRVFEQILEQRNVRPERNLEFYSLEALKRSVIEGVGITILPEVAVADEINRKRLIALPWEEGRLEVAVLMIWYKERWLSPTLKAFIEITREEMHTDSKTA
jgi:DNA-binding transcriptional LysR family regulator